MLKLNRTGNALNRDTRNKDNENWEKLEEKYDNLSEGIKDNSIGFQKLSVDVLGSIFNVSVKGNDLPWRLGSLSPGDGKPSPGNGVTRIRCLEYTFIERGIVRIADSSKYKFMVFEYSDSYDDTFIKASDWQNEDYFVQDSGYYKFIVAYEDDRAIEENEVAILGSLLEIRKTGIGVIPQVIANKQIMDFKYYNVPAEDSTEPLMYEGYVEIDQLEWQVNHWYGIHFRCEIKKDGQWVLLNRTINYNSSRGDIETPQNIVELGSGLWNVLQYDMESRPDRFFKFSLKSPIIAPEGIRFFFENKSTTGASYKGGIVLRGRQA